MVITSLDADALTCSWRFFGLVFDVWWSNTHRWYLRIRFVLMSCVSFWMVMIKLDTMEEKAWTGQNQVIVYSANSGLVLDRIQSKIPIRWSPWVGKGRSTYTGRSVMESVRITYLTEHDQINNQTRHARKRWIGGNEATYTLIDFMTTTTTTTNTKLSLDFGDYVRR